MKNEMIALCKSNKNICKICETSPGCKGKKLCVVCFATVGWDGGRLFTHRYHIQMQTKNFQGTSITREVKDESEMLLFIAKSKKEYEREIFKYIFKNFDRRRW